MHNCKNYTIAYIIINLNTEIAVAIEALPSFRSVIIAEMFVTFDVKGAAIEASLSDRLKPASAHFNALQSLAPSPHIPTVILKISLVFKTS